MPEIRGEQVVLRELTPADERPLRAMLETPEVGAWWGPPDAGFPWTDDPTATRFAVTVDGELAGLIQFGEETERSYRHAWIDIFMAPAFQGRGLGTDAVRTLARHLMDERGHHRITIDPALENAAAIRSYEKAGFRRVGVLEAAENLHGEWRDALLMEMVRRP